MATQKASWDGVPTAAAMVTSFRTMAPNDTVEAAALRAIHDFQRDFPVVEHGRVVGMVTQEQLLSALVNGRRNERIESLMARRFVVAAPGEMLSVVMEKLGDCRCRSLPVLSRGQLVGVLTMDQIGELVAARSGTLQSDERHLWSQATGAIMKRLLAAAAVALLTACSSLPPPSTSQPHPREGPEAKAGPPSMQHAHMAGCPMMDKKVDKTLTETDEGIAIVFSPQDGNVERLRKRLRKMLAEHSVK